MQCTTTVHGHSFRSTLSTDTQLAQKSRALTHVNLNRWLSCAGGFHPHAARPPSSIPALTVNLSAQAAVPQLTPADPDCFVWTCSCAVDPRTHASYLQVATLCNTTGCPLVFGLGVVGPFRLVAVVPSVDQDLDAFRLGMMGEGTTCIKHAAGLSVTALFQHALH